MNRVPIPDWNSEGVLPPFNPAGPTSSDRSPYCVSLLDIALKFGDSIERRSIIDGLLGFRAHLHSIGLVNGFQWLYVSFLEHIETIENRAPRDIDVVTFFHLPGGETQETLFEASPRVFDPIQTKKDYLVDAYFVHLNSDALEALVSQAGYWYSLWSHRRNGRWKGYLQIDLSSADDPIAKANLELLTHQGCRS
jgi:hypothetical protein